VAAATNRIRVASAVLTGFGGSISVGGASRTRGADLRGAGVLSVTTTVQRGGVGVLAGAGAITAQWIRTRSRPAALAASGQFAASCTRLRPAAAALGASGSLSGQTIRFSLRLVSAGIGGNGALAAMAVRVANVSGLLPAHGSEIIMAGAIRRRAVALDAYAILAALPCSERGAEASMTATGAFQGIARRRVRAFAANSINLGI
jgi:hypothetical protein